MAKYSGKPVTVCQPIHDLYNRINDFGSLQQRLDELPDDIKSKVDGNVRFEDDSLKINAPGFGEIKFTIAERIAPTLLRLTAENSPVPFNIVLNFSEKTPVTTEVSTDLDAEIPAMFRPLIGGKLQEAADKISEIFSNFFGAQQQ